MTGYIPKGKTLLEIAYDYISSLETPTSFNDLWNHICTETGLSSEEAANKVAAVGYTGKNNPLSSTSYSTVIPDVKGLIIFAIIAAIALISKKIRKKPLSPILLILISAGLGIVMYSI